MAVLVRAFRTETLKLRRTLALWMMLLAPAAVAAMNFLMLAQRPDLLDAESGFSWINLGQNTLIVWAALMLPLFVTLETALIAGAEHQEKHWKQLFTQPVPRWVLYVSKFLIGVLTLALASAALIGLLWVVGQALRLVVGAASFTGPFPWQEVLYYSGRIFLASLLVVAIHTWVANRWSSMYFSLGVGIMATVTNIFVLNSDKWSQISPWAMPTAAEFGFRPGSGTLTDMTTIWLWVGVALVVLLAGCVDFARRDVL